jgi:hypothetical protein
MLSLVQMLQVQLLTTFVLIAQLFLTITALMLETLLAHASFLINGAGMQQIIQVLAYVAFLLR